MSRTRSTDILIIEPPPLDDIRRTVLRRRFKASPPVETLLIELALGVRDDSAASQPASVAMEVR